MTIRTELDYSQTMTENLLRMSHLVHVEQTSLLSSIRGGHSVEQRLELPGDDVFLIRNFINSFGVTGMNLLEKLCWTRANVPFHVHESTPAHNQLLRLYFGDEEFRELVTKGDLPSLVPWRDNYAEKMLARQSYQT